MRSKKERDDQLYREVKQRDPQTYQRVAAFASTFGKHTEEISISTRYQVERFCMALAREGQDE